MMWAKEPLALPWVRPIGARGVPVASVAAKSGVPLARVVVA